MQSADVPAALALSTAVGWNQVAADWQRLQQIEPDGCFVAESHGTVIGTTVCCVFGTVAWLAMVIVTPAFRSRGLGRRLVQQGLDYAEQRGAVSVRLDATPLGEVVYRTFDFYPQFALQRMSGVARIPLAAVSDKTIAVVTGGPGDLDAILHLDQQATLTDRSPLLRTLCTETPPWVAFSCDGQAIGFLARRPGRMAEHLGPCCGTPAAAVTLLRHAFTTLAGCPVILDIPAARSDLLAIAADGGVTLQRTLQRMCRGPTVLEVPEGFHISYGGELG